MPKRFKIKLIGIIILAVFVSGTLGYCYGLWAVPVSFLLGWYINIGVYCEYHAQLDHHFDDYLKEVFHKFSQYFRTKNP